jgi:large subunit ribosomal protein L30
MAGRLRVTQVKSTISHIERNRATIRSLGLRRIGDTVDLPDNPATRGMVRQVRFLVRVEEVSEATSGRSRRSSAARPESRGDSGGSSGSRGVNGRPSGSRGDTAGAEDAGDPEEEA